MIIRSSLNDVTNAGTRNMSIISAIISAITSSAYIVSPNCWKRIYQTSFAESQNKTQNTYKGL